MNTMFNYWRWFLRGSGAKAGYRRLVNCWLLLHVAVGLALMWLADIDVATAANTVLLPLAGIFVGLSFAWAGNAVALLQSTEIDKLANHHEGGFVEYVYVYQTAILVILTTMVVWGLAGLGLFDRLSRLPHSRIALSAIKVLLFALSSMTVRECWHVVLGSQWMLLAQREIRKRVPEPSSGVDSQERKRKGPQ